MVGAGRDSGTSGAHLIPDADSLVLLVSRLRQLGVVQLKLGEVMLDMSGDVRVDAPEGAEDSEDPDDLLFYSAGN